MPIAEVLINGRVAEVDVPEGTTPEQIEAFFQENMPPVRQTPRGTRPLTPQPNQPFSFENAATALRYGGPVVAGMLGPPGLLAQAGIAGLSTLASELGARGLEGRPLDIKSAATEGLTAAGTAGALGGALNLASKGGRGLAEAFRGRREPYFDAAVDYAKQRGLPVPPSGVMDSGTSDVLQDIGERTLSGSSAASRLGRRMIDELSEPAQRLVAPSRFSGVQEGGTVVRNKIGEILNSSKATKDIAYKSMMTAIPEQGMYFPRAAKAISKYWDDWVDSKLVDINKRQAASLGVKLKKLLAGEKLDQNAARNFMAEINALKTIGATDEVWSRQDDILADVMQDYAEVGAKDVAGEALKASKDYNDLNRAVGALTKGKADLDVRGGREFLRGLFEQPSKKTARELLKRDSPDLFDDAKAIWVADRLDNPAMQLGKGIIDAGKVRKEWLVPYKESFIEMFGDDSYKAFENFLSYAEAAGPAAVRAQAKRAAGGNIGRITGPGAAGAAGFYAGGPLGAVASAGAAEVMGVNVVRALSNPNSALFKAFTKPTARERELAARMIFGFRPIAIIGGQAGAEAARMLGE